MASPPAKTADQMVQGLNDLQRYFDVRFSDWTPAERMFMLNQLIWTIHHMFDTKVTEEPVERSH